MTPIVLVPGLMCTAEIFAPQIPPLWAYGPVTVASTLVGETIADMASAILANAPPRFALAGISMGGYISFEIMRQAPERVTRLALIDTTARPDTPEQTANRRVLMTAAKKGHFRSAVSQSLPMLSHPDRRGDKALNEINLRMALEIGPTHMARQQEAIISRVDSRPSLARIEVPTLVAVGDSDPLTPPDRSEEIAAGIAGAKLVVIPQCGHCSTLEQPEAVNAALLDWLSP